MAFEIRVNYCMCHPETCSHWRYYIYLGDKRVVGSDDLFELERTIEELKEAK